MRFDARAFCVSFARYVLIRHQENISELLVTTTRTRGFLIMRWKVKVDAYMFCESFDTYMFEKVLSI